MKTKMVTAATVLAVVVSVVLVAFVAPGPGGERSVVAQTPPDDREYGYLDQVHNTYILAQWNPLYPGFGGLVLSIEGLGAVYVESGLQVTAGPNDTLDVSYSGAASLDAGATYDGIFGYTFMPSGSTQAATLTLSGTISADRVESNFEITVNSTPYTLQTTPFVHDAEAAAAEILDLFRDEQWVGVYDAFYSPFQAASAASPPRCARSTRQCHAESTTTTSRSFRR